MQIRGTQAHVAAWIELSLANQLEAVRTNLRISRSEAVRLAIQQFVINESDDNDNDRKENV